MTQSYKSTLKPKLVGFTKEQLEILEQEHAENLVKKELEIEKFEEKIVNYRRKHHVNRDYAIRVISEI